MGARTFDTPAELEAYVKEQLQGELAKLPLPCKKPAKFTYGSSFRDYVTGWSNYADVIKIPKANRYAVLQTFLDDQSQIIANGLSLSNDQKAEWDDAKQRLINVLDKYTSQSALKKQFVKSCQQSKETIAEYGARVSRLFNNAFEGEGDIDLLCSVFLNGLKSDTIAIQMTAYEPPVTGGQSRFHVILQQAQELESAISARVVEPSTAQSEVLQLSSASTNSVPQITEQTARQHEAQIPNLQPRQPQPRASVGLQNWRQPSQVSSVSAWNNQPINQSVGPSVECRPEFSAPGPAGHKKL